VGRLCTSFHQQVFRSWGCTGSNLPEGKYWPFLPVTHSSIFLRNCLRNSSFVTSSYTSRFICVHTFRTVYYSELFCTLSKFGAIFLYRILSNNKNKHKLYQNIFHMSPVLGQIYAPFTIRSSLCRGEKIEKFDMKTKFCKQMNPILLCRNFRPIEWHQKPYYKISWDHPFNTV
jgi:hypothetical protein